MKYCDINMGGIFLITLSTIVNSVPLAKDNKISRQTREAESLKEQLQKLRQILRDVNGKEQTTLPTTTVHESADDIFNEILGDLKHGDKAGVLLLANALKKLRREHESENHHEDNRNGDGVGDYLGTNDVGHHKDHQMSSDEILDVLRKLYNKEREKSLREQSTTLPTTTTTISQDNTDLRMDVLHAIEKKLLRDIGIAVNYGFTPQEIIKDLQKQALKRISPRSVNNNYMAKDLKALKSATKVYLEDR